MNISRLFSILILFAFALGQSVVESNNRVKRQDVIKNYNCPISYVVRFFEKKKYCIPCDTYEDEIGRDRRWVKYCKSNTRKLPEGSLPAFA
ncbi:unnamed protein product [Arctia plantaginis]|uniref:Uncharacterized protein n=1 Tax=Arctia plantaginis TaxID=874455 RepID=A0A8S0Z411_ARCPL|nr:unnamed protein product [Arctia plantaginis]